MAFRSEILIKLDKKGRVLLPAAFRDELPAEDRGAFVLYHSPNAKVLSPPSLKEMVADFASKTANRHEKKIPR